MATMLRSLAVALAAVILSTSHASDDAIVLTDDTT